MHAFRFFLLFLKHILYIQTGRGGMLLNEMADGRAKGQLAKSICGHRKPIQVAM